MNNFDKVYHSIVCMTIVLVASVFLPLWASVLLAALVAIGKEMWDMMHPDNHTADWVDLAADFFGIIVAVGVILA